MDQNNKSDIKYNAAVARNIAYRITTGAYTDAKTIESVKHKLGIRSDDNRFDKEIKGFVTTK